MITEEKKKKLWQDYDRKYHEWLKEDSGTETYEKKHKELAEIMKSMRQC